MAYVSWRCLSKPCPANQAWRSCTPSHSFRLRSHPDPVASHDRSRPVPAAPRSLVTMAPYYPSDIMTPEQAVAFLLFAVAAAGTPGPSNVLLTATGANVGVLRGLPSLLGVTIGMGVMMFVVAFGLGSVVLANPAVLRALNWIGAAFLLWLAWKIATAGRGDAAAGRKPVGFIGAAAFQWINPTSGLVGGRAWRRAERSCGRAG